MSHSGKRRQQAAVEEGEPWAAKVLRLGDHIVMNAASPKTLRTVLALGFDASAVDISEFMKMEAGLTCMSLICP
jgi:dimethylargininase